MELLESQLRTHAPSESQRSRTRESQQSTASLVSERVETPPASGGRPHPGSFAEAGKSLHRPVEISDDSHGGRGSQEDDVGMAGDQHPTACLRPTETSQSCAEVTSSSSQDSTTLPRSLEPSRMRMDAYNAMLGNSVGGEGQVWETVGLISVAHNHTHVETELGDG